MITNIWMHKSAAQARARVQRTKPHQIAVFVIADQAPPCKRVAIAAVGLHLVAHANLDLPFRQLAARDVADLPVVARAVPLLGGQRDGDGVAGLLAVQRLLQARNDVPGPL